MIVILAEITDETKSIMVIQSSRQASELFFSAKPLTMQQHTFGFIIHRLNVHALRRWCP